MLEFAEIAVNANQELKGLTGPMLRGIHSSYVPGLLGRKTKSASAQPEGHGSEVITARQMIGSSFPAVLTIEDDGEQFIEKHSVRVDAVPDQPAKVCFVFKRDGVWRSLIMRATQAVKAVKLLPTRVHLMSAPFLSSRAMSIINKLPL